MTKRSYHPTDGRTGNGAASDAIRERRAAIEDLGAALRTLLQVSASTEAGADEIRLAAAELRRVTGPLAASVRTRAQQPSADDLLGGIRMYNPVSGTGSGLAPPVDAEVVDGVVVGTCTLGLAYEGPPTYAHGGVSALLLDHMLGYATTASGHPGMTVELTTRYRAPVPLQTPLRLTGRVTEVLTRKVIAHGTIATAADPDTVLVEATGTFVAIRPEKVRALWGSGP
ncbi:PaaI family thioesterase [Virgisporangium aurantiacum]|uniref:Acyl-coenzyme A thioesterase THEM4 n=1 Tax=Virgisporangium aurantiacum TaxID=175570 RepID=A0A8J3ZB16_9ACTN|nr:PaaI family thioesterase [Virgisporangium aurantiacum]GIJ60661.1 thioesterase [Virgisporangium aurantiacum]